MKKLYHIKYKDKRNIWIVFIAKIEKLKKMIDTGVPIRNWGIVTKNGKTYYIRYTCLERGKVILK